MATSYSRRIMLAEGLLVLGLGGLQARRSYGQGTSATDPPTGEIHIDPSQTNRVDVMLHELGHAWSYPVVDNEGCLTWDLVNDHLDHDPTID